MKLIHSSQDALLIGHLRNVLDAESVPTQLRNESLRMASGDIPPQECWLELWVDDSEAERATALVADALAEPEDEGSAWTCASCSEPGEANLDECWSCGAPRD